MTFRRFMHVTSAIGIVLFTLSCSSSKKTATTTERKDIKGNWVLQNISYEGLPQNQNFKLTLLDEGNADCLKGSTWVFPNNGYGNYTIAQSGPGCTAGQRNIVWSYRVENGQEIIQYKRLEGGVKAKDITDGYKFNIVSATGNSLVLSSKVNYEGNTISINYSFERN